MLPVIGPELFDAIAAHAAWSADDVLLRARLPEGVPAAFVAAQVQARRERAAKFPTWAAQPHALFPPRLALEQASSEHVAHYTARAIAAFAHELGSAAERVVDLTAGMGVDLFALAHVFASARIEAHERDADLCAYLEHNAGVFGVRERWVTRHGDGAASFLTSGAQADVVYLDPARRSSTGGRVHGFAACEPDPTGFVDALLERAPFVAIKASPMLDIDRGVSELRHVSEVHVVASEGDCKQLLFIVARDAPAAPRIVVAEGRRDAAWKSYAFTREEAAAATAAFAEPLGYLFDPGPAAAKAGGFALIAQTYGLAKIAPNTHLYTADEPPAMPFPGRAFRVAATAACHARAARELFPEGRALLIARNVGEGTEAVRRQLKLSDGGTSYAIALRDARGRRVLLRAERVPELEWLHA